MSYIHSFSAICLRSDPQTFVYGETKIAILTQQGAEDYLIVQDNEPVANTDTNIKISGIRRRIISTKVDDRFLNNSEDHIVASGIATMQRTGSDISLEMDFSVKITLMSQPSDAPSDSPSITSRPSYSGPTPHPTSSREPSENPSKSMMPTEEQTIDLNTCKCDTKNNCLQVQNPVILTILNPNIRLCLQASPSNSEIASIPDVIVKGKKQSIPLQTQIDGNFAIVTGELNDDEFFSTVEDFDIGVLGQVEIFVEWGNKRATVGFFESYVLEIATEAPSSSPTISSAPTDLPPLGVRACLCVGNVCVTDINYVTYKERSVRICLTSTPPQSELIQIDTCFFENDNGVTQSAVIEGASTNQASTIEKPGSNKRLQIVDSELDLQFIIGDKSAATLKAKGIVTVKPLGNLQLSMRAETLETSFEVLLYIGEDPSSTPR